MEKNIKIAVIGGTGKAGKYLVHGLLKKGYSVKLLARNPEKIRAKDPRIEIVKGDVLDYKSVLTLMDDCTALISTLGQRKGEKPVFGGAADNITDAMKSLKITRYIMVTGLTLDTEQDRKSLRTRLMSRFMKLSFPAIIADKQKEFALIKDSGLDWTVVRVPLIEQTESSGEIKVDLSDCPGKKISATDLASFLIDQLEHTLYIRKAPFVSN
jgi:putative NADH-flavin reductase